MFNLWGKAEGKDRPLPRLRRKNGGELKGGDYVTVKVCDAIMGSGKTESAIHQINTDHDSRYIFITPYLDEVERIKKSCADRHFAAPINKGDGKLDDLHKLIASRVNIASTHALFRRYNETTLSLIQAGGYKLILDEVFEVYEHLGISKKDLDMLTRDGMISVDDEGVVHWLKDGYEGRFEDLRDMCLTESVILHNNVLVLWMFPIDVFKAFKDVIILTYMFDAQAQKYYFDMNDVEIEYIGTEQKDGEFHFCDQPHIPEYVRTLREKIHILDDEKLNGIGNSYTSLSSSWYDRARNNNRWQIKQLKDNIGNVFKNRFQSGSGKNLWTCFKPHSDALKGKGYTKGFVACNIRATNAYRDRDCLAYCVNIFYNPLMKNYFLDHNVLVKEEKYALSEMVQWIWRSAIRDGNEIWIYIPSKRMRTLLINWLDDLSFLSDSKREKMNRVEQGIACLPGEEVLYELCM